MTAPGAGRGRCRHALGCAALRLCGLAALPPATAAGNATTPTPAPAPLHLTTALHLVVDEGAAPLRAAPARQLDWRQLPGTWQPLALPQEPVRPLAVPALAAPPAAGTAIRTSWYRWRLPADTAGDAAWALYAARVHSDGPQVYDPDSAPMPPQKES